MKKPSNKAILCVYPQKSELCTHFHSGYKIKVKMTSKTPKIKNF